MEQQAAQYWMWMKRKHVMKARIQASTMMMKPYDSWEEQAFAEDAAGPLGGCIWPPRSYSCSFCRREFRSAQALGGHMNVHRRDRARLKQSLSPQNEVDHNQIRHDGDHEHKINNNPYKSSCTTQCPSADQPCSTLLDYNHYSNCSPSVIASSSLSTSRVSASSTLENFSEQTLLSPYSKSSPYLCTPFGSKSEKYTENEELLLGMGRHGDCVNTDLSVGLNYLVVQRNRQPTTDGSDGDDQVISCKRHKTFANTPFPFFLKPCCLNPSSMDQELDLELRLGDRSTKGEVAS